MIKAEDVINETGTCSIVTRFATAFNDVVHLKHGQKRYRCTYFDHYIAQRSYNDDYGIKFSIRDNGNFEPSSVEDLKLVALAIAKRFNPSCPATVLTRVADRDILDRDLWECTVIIVTHTINIGD